MCVRVWWVLTPSVADTSGATLLSLWLFFQTFICGWVELQAEASLGS